jgi:cell division protein FtsL
MAALPLALLVFIVLAAISLVLTARLDERWNR